VHLYVLGVSPRVDVRRVPHPPIHPLAWLISYTTRIRAWCRSGSSVKRSGAQPPTTTGRWCRRRGLVRRLVVVDEVKLRVDGELGVRLDGPPMR